MHRPRVVIEIAPSALRLSVYTGGRCVGSRALSLPHGEWPRPWNTLLDQTLPDLSAMTAELGCTGAPCRIVCQAPTAVVTTHSCAAAAGPGAAVAAANLQLGTIATFDAAASDVRTLFQDPAGHDEHSPPQIHTIAAADTEDNLRLLADWANAAGLIADGVCPTEAIAACAAVAALNEGPASNGLSAFLWLADHIGVLVVGHSRRLMYIRTVGVGIETLVDALMKPLRGASLQGTPEQSAMPLDRTQARALLNTLGIPAAEQPLDGFPGLTGAAILPGLQPVLQRLAVEIKQSLRFGIRDEHKGEAGLAKFRLLGPGASVPRLAATLARLSSTQLSIPEGPSQTEADTVIHACSRLAHACPCLTSHLTSDRLSTRRARLALAAGVGVAACLLAAETLSLRGSVTREEQRLASVKAQCDGTAGFADVQRTALESRVAAAATESRVARRLGSSAPWGLLLGALASSVPDEIRLTSVRVNHGDGDTPPSCTLRGFVAARPGADSAAAIKRLADSMQMVPLVAEVRLGSTSKSTAHGGEARTFELALDVVPLPALAVMAAAEPAGDTER